MKKIAKKTISVILKIAVAVLAYGFIIYQLKNYNINDFIIDDFFSDNKILLLSACLILMPFNWYVETLKWQFLIKRIEKIPTRKAFFAVLTGVAFAISTPNRIGELGGRIFVLSKQNRVKGIVATAAGSLSQLFVTLFFGLISGIFMLSYFNYNLNEKYLYLVEAIVIISVLIVSFLFFNLKTFVRISLKIEFMRKISNSLKVLTEYSRIELFTLLLYSSSKYFIFLIQFYILLLFFDINIQINYAFMAISLTYLLNSIIPSVTLSEIGVRGSAAIFFLGMFSENSPGILYSSVLLWIINLAVPAIIGSLFFYKTKI